MFCCGFIPKASVVVWNSPRHLCSVATKAALRPFYFAVHPDLFGQHPQLRVVNEESLKKLNSYLESIEEKIPVRPTHLTFHLKNAVAKTSCVQGSESFKTVQFSLSSHDLNLTVSHILKTCGMLEDFLPMSDEGKTFQKKTFYSQLRNNQYHGDLNHPLQNGKYTAFTLEEFLGQHIGSAKEKLEKSAVLWRENEKLSKTICRELNLKKLVSHSKWGLGAHQGSLRTFLQLYSTKRSEFCGLNGRTVVFANCTDVDPLGRVMLAVQDVPEVWLSLINSLADYDVLVGQVPFWEGRVSRVLGGMKISYDAESSPTATVADYLNHLQKVMTTLKRGSHGSHHEHIKARDFAGLEGRILRDSVLEAHAIDGCMTRLGLQSLQKDDSVCPIQMTKCCERLVRCCSNLELQDTRLIVSTFYSVTTDGFINIPWDWT